MSGTNSIIGGGENGNSSSSVPFYWPIGGTYNNFSTEAQVETQINAACTLQSMCINGSTGFGSGATVVLDHNGSTGNQTVTWTGEINTPTIMEDTTHTDSISAGDTVDYQRSALASFLSVYASSITMNASSPAVEYILSTSATTAFPTTANYQPIAGDWNNLQNDSTENSWLWTHLSEAGTFSHAQMNVASASSGTITAQVRHNGANANEVVVVSSGTGITVDSTHTDSVILGDYMTWAVSSTNSSGYAQVFALLFEGTNSAHTLMGGYGYTSNFSGPNYFPMVGRSTTNDSTESYTQINATYAFTSSYFRMNSNGWSGRSSTTTCTFRNNNANGNQILYTSANFTVDVTHTDSVASGDPYDCVQTATGNLSQMQMSVDDGSYDGHGTTAYFPPWLDVGANTASQISINVNGDRTATLSKSIAFGTSGPNELVVVAVTYNMNNESTGTTVSSITESTSTLSFSHLATILNPASGNNQALEIWTAQATSQYNSAGSSNTWTVDFTSAVDNGGLQPYAICGLQSLSSPFDPNGSLPATAYNSSNTTPPTVTYSTTNAADLLMMVTGCATGPTPSGPSAPWSNYNMGTFGSGNGDEYSTARTCFLQVDSVQTSATVEDSSSSSSATWVSIVLAFTGNVGTVTYDETITESLTAADTVSENADWATAISETLSALDAVAANGLVSASISETLDAADDVGETLVTPNCAVVVIIMH